MASPYFIEFTDPSDKPTFSILPSGTNGPTGSTRTLDIELVGTGTVLWGKKIEENLVHMLENFSCPEDGGSPGNPDSSLTYSPTTPTRGQLWFNSTTDRMFMWDGAAWIQFQSNGAAAVGDLDMGTFKIFNMAQPAAPIGPNNPADPDQAATTKYVHDRFIDTAGDEMSGDLILNNSGVGNLYFGGDGNDYITLDQTDDTFRFFSNASERFTISPTLIRSLLPLTVDGLITANANIVTGTLFTTDINFPGDAIITRDNITLEGATTFDPTYVGNDDFTKIRIQSILAPSAREIGFELGSGNEVAKFVAGTFPGNRLDMLNNPITNVAYPSASTDAATQQYVNDIAGAGASPTGAVVPFAGSVAPTGWLICDGSSLPTSAALFAVIGYTYGGFGGSFNIPDLQDEFIRGASGSHPLGTAQSDQTNNFEQAQTLSGGGGWFGPTTIPENGDWCTAISRGNGAGSHTRRYKLAGVETHPRNVAMHYIIKYI